MIGRITFVSGTQEREGRYQGGGKDGIRVGGRIVFTLLCNWQKKLLFKPVNQKKGVVAHWLLDF